MTNNITLTEELLTQIAKEIISVDKHKPNEGYWCHGEWHDFQRRISEKEIVQIIAEHLGVQLKTETESKKEVIFQLAEESND